MNESVQFLVRHGYSVLFVWVLAEQLGLPLPAMPLLLAAGALAGAGKLNFGAAIVVAVFASLVGDTLWYEIGRRRGGQVLNFLCRVSLEPDSCVRRTESTFAKHGVWSLVVAKFVPGLSTVAPPLAGIFRMRLSRFLLFDGLGALIWVGGFAALGYVFSNQLERVASSALELGTKVVVLVLAGLAGYILWKYLHRQRFLRELRVARITPEELQGKLNAGENMVIVDLRHSMDFEAEPEVIPGAVHLSMEDVDAAQDAIPRDREIVLYCT